MLTTVHVDEPGLVTSLDQCPFFRLGIEDASSEAGSGPVVLAVSGGGDSVAMAVLAARWARRSQRPLLAVTVDHALRADSADEARRVGQIMARLEIPHRIVRWRHSGVATAMQERARIARYHLLQSVCRDVGAQWLLTAHTADDQAETVAMRVLRGSGPDGLAGMASVRELGDGIIHGRPLLDWRRSDLRAVCRAESFDWIEDPSNRDGRFMRIRLRRWIAAADRESARDGLEGDLTTSLTRVARVMGALRGHIEQAVSTAMADLVEIFDDGGAEIDATDLANLPPAVADRVAARVMTIIGGRRFPVDPVAGGRTAALARDGGPRLTLAGCLVRLTVGSAGGRFQGRRVLRLVREPGRTTARVQVAAGETVAWDNRFLVGPTPRSGWIVARCRASWGDVDETEPGSRGKGGFDSGVRRPGGDSLETVPVLTDAEGRPIAAPVGIAFEGTGERDDGGFVFRWAPGIFPPPRPFGVVGTRGRII